MRTLWSLALAVWASAVVQAQAQPAICDDPGGFCRPKISTSCLLRLGAGSMPSDAETVETEEAAKAAQSRDCPAQTQAYGDCVAQAAEQCDAGATRPEPALDTACSDATAIQLWGDLKTSDSIRDLETFARLCDGRPQAALAANRAQDLRNDRRLVRMRGDEILGFVADVGNVFSGQPTTRGAPLGGACSVGADCQGYLLPVAGRNYVACCGGHCQQTKLDWANFPYCPRECRGGPFSGPGSC